MDTGFRRYDGIEDRIFTKKLGFRIPFKFKTRNPKFATYLLSDFRSRRVGRQQNIHQLLERRVRLLADFVEFYRADRMLHDQHRMVRRAEGFLFRLGQRGKCVGDESHGKLAALLNL